MTDLLIVNPAAAHGIYGPLGDDLIAVEPPLWCRLLAGAVRDKGHEVTVLDAEALQLNGKKAAGLAHLADPRLVCIAVYGHQPSASTQQMWGASQFAKEFRRLSDVEMIMVGGHPSALPERTLREETPIDYVGIGEGHETLAGLLTSRPHAHIPGLAWWDGKDTVRINRRPSLVEDLRALHGHAWDLLPMDRYRAHNWQCFGDLRKRQPYASIYTSLGCPYQCTFCCINAPFGANRYRMRDPAVVVDEIEHLHEDHGVSTLKITDEMFVLNERHYTAICEKLVVRGLGDKLNIWAYARVDTVKPATLRLLRKAGIQWLALGIESASKHVRDGAKKTLRQDDIVGTVHAIQDAGINVIGNFMFGLRDDDYTTMRQTLDLAIACMPDFANFYSCMAYPGSGLWEQANEKGWTLPPSWGSFSQHNAESHPLDTEHVSGAEVLRFRDQAFTAFFTHPAYRDHVKAKFGAETLAHVDAMTTYKLKRKLLEKTDAGGMAGDREGAGRALPA